MRRSLYSYIKKNVDDRYIMDVVYYCMRKTIIKIVFNGGNMSTFNISTRFVLDPIELGLNAAETKATDVFAVLLSLRALMLDPGNIELCSNDSLIFKRGARYAYGWLDFANLIVKYNDDDDFHQILCMLSALCDDEELTDEDKQEFIDNTICPECRNIKNYYREAASRTENIPKDVIPNNAYLCDYKLTNLIIGAKQGYVGNTAIAYCPNLRIIRIENPSLMFGKFPLLECSSLEHIYVPSGSIGYYKKNLPFYKDIIEEEMPKEDVEEGDVAGEATIVASEDVNIKSEEISEPQQRTKGKMLGRMFRYVKENIKEKLVKKEPEVVDETIKDEQRTDLIKKSLEKKVTTYKYFWLLAILHSVKTDKDKDVLAMDMLNMEMVIKSWKFSKVLNGTFPKGDQLPMLANELEDSTGVSSSEENENTVRGYLYYDCKDNKTLSSGINKLANNAPYRFLSPWIPFTTASDVIDKSKVFKNDCPYYVSKEGVVINPAWMPYFERNADALIEFVESELCEYLDISSGNEDIEDRHFVDGHSVCFEKASRNFLNSNCRVVMAEDGYYLELSDEYIKLGSYPEDMNMSDGSIWIKRPKIGSNANRLVHVCGNLRYQIGEIEETDKEIIFTDNNGNAEKFAVK